MACCPLRLVYFDVDGTLVDARRRFLPQTLAALHTARQQGVRIGLATGRMAASAAPYAQAIAADAPLILYNGGQIVAPDSAAILWSACLPLPAARQALAIAYDFGVHVNLYAGNHLYIDRLTETARASLQKDGVSAQVVGNLQEFLQTEPVKLLLIGAPDTLDAMAARYRGQPDAAPAELVRSEDDYLEILPAGVSKGAALLRICQHLGISPCQVAAFGDGLNDLELLRCAGIGVAMANAHPTLRAATPWLAGHHDTEGPGPALLDLLAQFRPADAC